MLYEAGDRFLLGTDGVVEGIYDAQLQDLLRTPDAAAQKPAQRLVAASVGHTTTVVVEVV